MYKCYSFNFVFFPVMSIRLLGGVQYHILARTMHNVHLLESLLSLCECCRDGAILSLYR